LKSFLNSGAYNSQAVDLAKRMIGSLANKSAFDDLLTMAFPELDAVNITDIVDISKNIARNLVTQASLCGSLAPEVQFDKASRLRFCDFSTISDADLAKYLSTLDQKKVVDIYRTRQELIALTNEQIEISRILAPQLRRKSGVGLPVVDLSGCRLEYIDLSGVDFRNINISNVYFDQVKLSGAIFVPLRGTPMVTGTNWWDAKEIEPSLLKFLIDGAFPGVIQQEGTVGDKELTRDFYVSRVVALCGAAKISCDPSKLQFNRENVIVRPFPSE
jgi:uncharacterized protein YjbI with pentapeptide repeats